MKYKELKKQNEEFQEHISTLTNTIVIQSDVIDSLNEKFATEINKFEKRYKNQLKVQDNELARRLTIIHYLEDRLFKGEYDV